VRLSRVALAAPGAAVGKAAPAFEVLDTGAQLAACGVSCEPRVSLSWTQRAGFSSITVALPPTISAWNLTF
jgi:hypothetical protein